MPRVQVQDPLQNTPTLQPTSRPLGIGAGARPAARAQDNGIFALAQSLSEFQPALRQLLADKERRDADSATTIGELKAAELSAAQRMQEINGKFKTYVDDGTVPKSQLPFFQIGFSRRTGRDVALTDFQTALDDAYKSTTTVDGRADPEAIINQALTDYRAKLPEGDVYALKGFDETAQQVAQNFRQRSNGEYRKNYEQAAETKIANEGIDLLQQHVLADPDQKDASIAAFRNYFTNLKETELPKSEVAPFIVKNAVSPMVEDLVARGDFDGADQLVEDMEKFDVTGQGGLLGNMSSTKGTLAQMKLSISEQRRRADDPTEAFKKKTEAAYFQGNADAKVALVGLGDGVLTAPLKKKLIADYTEKNRQNPWAVSTFSDYLDATYRKGMTEDDPAVVASISRLAESTNTTQLDQAKELLSHADTAGTVSPKTQLHLEDLLSKRRTLYGLITDEDTRAAERTIYRSEFDNQAQQVVPTFSSGEKYLSDSLTPAQRLQHRQGTMQFYRDALAAKLRNGGFASGEEAQAALPQLRAQSLSEAVSYADKLTASFLPKEGQQAAHASANPTRTTKRIDPLKGVVNVAPTPTENNDRNRAAFISFFAEPFQGSGADWKVSDAALSGQIAKLTSNPGDGPLTPLRPTTAAEDAAAKERLKPVLIYRSVKDSYYSLVKYRERGSDNGDPAYIKRLRELATNLKTYGGAEYLTPDQLTNLGLNPAAFPTAGTKAGLIQ